MEAKKLLIVGGGSAGWMAAAYLEAALRDNGRRDVEVALIESPDVPRIGVGEATIPNIKHILSVIGIDEIDFLRQVSGTFKQAIKYVDWLHGAGEHYYHPFDGFRVQPIDRAARRWLMSDRSIPFADTTSLQPVVCELGLAPKPLASQTGGPSLAYAYHMDALKFADLLTGIATARGVRHHIDHVTGVERADNGDIAAVHTRSGQRLEADLYIDCTGFASLLIEKELGVGWVDCSQWLLCNRAVTLNVPYEHHYSGHVRPYTTATALSSGWVWEIPLQHRKALGYVHSSDFISEDEAVRELKAFEGPHAQSLDTRTVHFRVGHRAKVWARNCIAIGLAGNFIEPLESTGLYLSDLATVMLAEHFPHEDADREILARRYNRIMANRFYEILDFINMHYCLTRRSDTPFWREIRRPERVNDRLRAKLAFWRTKLPSKSDFVDQFLPGQAASPLPDGGLPGDHRPPVDTAGVFGIESYEAILYGMDFLADESDRWFGRDRPATKVPRFIVENLKRAPRALPAHDVWLQRLAGMPVFPRTRGHRS
ncbi:tryptophan halogenase family protein [Lentisalinibacter sediminis]|uniref:tryptophan halogenase family protein n=1 Tax=Lentisalinibacter sediminis TaxID=2992237 RepID=UPI00386B4B4C